jgi:hypothetical protein
MIIIIIAISTYDFTYNRLSSFSQAFVLEKMQSSERRRVFSGALPAGFVFLFSIRSSREIGEG